MCTRIGLELCMFSFVTLVKSAYQKMIFLFLNQNICCGYRALDHTILGPTFGPIPNAEKYVFSPIPDKKIP